MDQKPISLGIHQAHFYSSNVHPPEAILARMKFWAVSKAHWGKKVESQRRIITRNGPLGGVHVFWNNIFQVLVCSFTKRHLNNCGNLKYIGQSTTNLMISTLKGIRRIKAMHPPHHPRVDKIFSAEKYVSKHRSRAVLYVLKINFLKLLFPFIRFI